jgi:hypothetical protein
MGSRPSEGLTVMMKPKGVTIERAVKAFLAEYLDTSP